LSTTPIDTADPAEKAAKRGQPRQAPQVARSSGIKPLLLADKADYTLGFVAEGGKADRVAACQSAYLTLLGRCQTASGEPAVQAVRAFLTRDPLGELVLPEDFDGGALITFRVEGVFPIDLPAVQVFWAKENNPDTEEGGATPIMQCIICGERRPVLARLQGKIKGVPGGQMSGTSIISANAEAFESYGLKNSLIAPTCAVCGERFTKAANDLIASVEHRVRIGDLIFLAWTRTRQGGFGWNVFLSEPEAADVAVLLEGARTGKQSRGLDAEAFYVTVLSGSGGRTVVRDWIDTTVGQAQANLALWFDRQRMVDGWGAPGDPLSVYRLAVATVRESRDLNPLVAQSLMHSAIQGTPLPLGLVFQAVRRNRAEQTVTYNRAALIKLVLNSRSESEAVTVSLDESNNNAAYRCGRLFAVLEEAQKLAVPGIKATIVDRFFGTASSAPLSVFGRLLAGVQPHLSKLERDRPAAAHALQTRMEEILSGLLEIPRTLSLEDQAHFSLGYYHQRAHDRHQATEAAARRRAASAEGAGGSEPAVA
jgi:CRISPR-associated protein Csd1